MTKKYFTWFLQNFDNYEYFGDESNSIRRRLKRMSERTIAPSPQEAIEIYVAFFKHYNGDPFSEKSKYIDGIRAKRNEYCLMFRDPDNTPIPFAYKKEMAAGVTEGELKDVLDAEKDRKIKYYSDMIDYHSGVMQKTEEVIDDITESVKPHATNVTTIGFFFLAVVFAALAATIFFVPSVAQILGVIPESGELVITTWVALGLSGSLLILYTVLGFIAGKKYAYYSNSNLIMYRMEDFKKRINKNITRLRKYDTQPMRLALRNGKKVKPVIVDTDYNRELRYFGTSLELIQRQLEEETKAARVLYYFVMVITMYAVSFFALTPIANFLARTSDYLDILIYVFPAVPTVIFALVGLKLKNRVRAWKVFFFAVISCLVVGLLVLLGFQPVA